MRTILQQHEISGLQGYEVNTDGALVNPDWEDFAELHDRRYSLAISQLKSMVRGRQYDNGAMRVRVSRHGYYVQSRRFPAAFFGDTSPATVRRVDGEEARAISWEAAAYYRSGEAESLTCIYAADQQGEFFFGYRIGANRRMEMGSLRSRQGMHMRVMLNADEPAELIGGERRGVVILQQLANGSHVLITAPGRRQPFPVMDDISD